MSEISLCILAKTNDEWFRALIDSALPHVDEIIVGVDTDSNGGIDGYKDHQVLYLPTPVNGNFSAARNAILAKAKHPWRMTLDTDETLPADLWPRLRAIADAAVEPVVCFPRNNAIAGLPERLSWPDWQPRLHKEHVRWKNGLHEELVPGERKEYLSSDRAHAILHTKTVADQHAAIRRYVGLQGVKQAILIFEYQRPNYLRVCLDSIASCEGVDDWSILLSIDGPDHLTEFEPHFGRVTHVIPWDSHAGNLWHVTRSLEFAFSCGFERVLFMDGDCIMRRDTLTEAPKLNGEYMFTGFAKGDHGEGPMPWFHPQGNLLEAGSAEPLLAWVRSKQWVGRRRPGHHSTLQIDYPGYDAVFCRYMLDHGLQTRYRAKSYIGHIGVVGTDCHAPEIEAEIFAGHPSRWLGQAIKAFDPKRHHTFTPEDFRYEV